MFRFDLKLFFSFFLALILSFVFFGTNSVSATVLYSATATTTNFTDGPLSYDLFLVGTSSQSLTSGDDLWLVYYSDVATDDFELGIVLGSSTYAVWDTAPYTSYLSNLTELSNTSTLVSSGVYRHVVALDVATTVSDTNYWFSIRHSDGGQGEDVMVSSGSTSYTSVYGNTSIYDKTSRAVACISTLTNATDCDFAPPDTGPTIRWSNPSADVTSTLRSSSWFLDVSNLVLGRTYDFYVQYGYSSSSLDGQDIQRFVWTYTHADGSPVTSSVIGVPMSRTLIPQAPATSSLMYAIAGVIDSENNFSTSDLVTFYVVKGQSGYIQYESSTLGGVPLSDLIFGSGISTSTESSTNPFYVNCDDTAETILGFPTGAALACSAKKGLGWFAYVLIYPPQLATDIFTESVNDLKTKFPINIIFGFTDTLQAWASQGSNQKSLTLNFPAIDFEFEFLGPDTLQTQFGTSTKNAIFEAQGHAMWIITALIIITTIL